MRRGSILHYVLGGQRLRMVVLTADRYNPRSGLVAPMGERSAEGALPAFLIPLDRPDWPTAAFIDLSRTRRLEEGAVVGAAGQLSAETLRRLSTAVRHYLGAN
jgi:hypothetical protein